MTQPYSPMHPRTLGAPRGGVTLVEILIVFVIAALLLAFLLPAVQRARESARRASCENNLRQIGLAIKSYAETRRQLPEPAPSDAIGGWVLAALPFIEETTLADQLATNPSLDPATVSRLAHQRPQILTCPSGYDGDSTIAAVPVCHYLFQVLGRRNSRRADWQLIDAPRDSRIAWIASPEDSDLTGDSGPGPHFGGFNGFYSRSSRIYFSEAQQ